MKTELKEALAAKVCECVDAMTELENDSDKRQLMGFVYGKYNQKISKPKPAAKKKKKEE